MRLGIAALRIVVGTLFMGHGLQKLTGWLGGHGLEATGKLFEKLGLRPGRVQAATSGVAETTGGALLAAGCLTPAGSSLISGAMLTAIRKVHWPKGVWVSDGGYEYNLVLLATAFAITDAGPCSPSVDAALGRPRWGRRWAVAQLAAGVIGSAAAVALGARQGEETAASSMGAEEERPPAERAGRDGQQAPAKLHEEVDAAAEADDGAAALAGS